jgi:hypothetical protein
MYIKSNKYLKIRSSFGIHELDDCLSAKELVDLWNLKNPEMAMFITKEKIKKNLF